MSEIEKPTNWHLTEEANAILDIIIKNRANPQKSTEIAPLGMTLALKDESHQSFVFGKKLEPTGPKHKGRYAELADINGLGLIYEATFPNANKDDVWLNLEKAASVGILLLKERYLTDENLIDWEAIKNDYT
jgi:hypothetical protein|tara:strand:+ start:356 stop:751 length:396 start_codon:yes stop_codon:yes gene_type:complete